MACLAKYQGKSIYQGQIDFMNSFLKADQGGARP